METSLMWTTGVAGDGLSPYTQAQVTDWLRRSFCKNPADEGVIPDFPTGSPRELAPSVAAQNVTLAPGAAWIYGFPYDNSANRVLAIPIPTIGTTGHRIVLRANWTTRQVRLTLLSSSNGVAAIPALTQTANTTWDIPICSLTITTGGVIMLTDERRFCRFNTRVSAAMMETASVATAALQDNAVTTAKLADLNVTTAKIADLAITNAKIANSTITQAKLASGAALNNILPNDGLGSGLDADLVRGVAIAIAQRRGGDAANWATPGTTVYTPSGWLLQCGASNWSGAATTGALGPVVTFPQAFSGTPVVVAVTQQGVTVGTGMILAASFRWSWSATSNFASVDTHWIAIGPP